MLKKKNEMTEKNQDKRNCNQLLLLLMMTTT